MHNYFKSLIIMNINKPKVVFIGGIETGKTTAIQLLWEDEAISIKEYDGCMEVEVREMIPGREYVKFDVIELPRIHYTSENWYKNNALVKERLSSADIVVVTIPLNDVSVMSHKQYLKDVFDFVTLKQSVSIVIALTMSDKILTPISAKNIKFLNRKDRINSINIFVKKERFGLFCL